HTGWAYCHVPHGADVDMADRVEAQVERFAPGFRDRILARHVSGPRVLEASNRNYAGGDFNGGVMDLKQIFARPVPRLVPYMPPLPGSSSRRRSRSRPSEASLHTRSARPS